jgi:hypothetical protein
VGAGCPITAYFVSNTPAPVVDTTRFKDGVAVKVSSNDTWELEYIIPLGSMDGKPNEEFTFYI